MQLVYDGGCPFCRSFAATSELRGGLPDLEILDGRADTLLRQRLSGQGFNLADGAILIEGERIWHGADAVNRLCEQMRPSDPLLRLVTGLFADSGRSRRLYPLLLVARRLALALQGLRP
nr:DCC1-like thiol-disulfide oxidoreductase family protein [Synechococcus sp. Tobar12-5m-g]